MAITQSRFPKFLPPRPLVLFDLDGTLIDSEIGITRSIEHALRALDVEPPSREVLRGWIGPPLRTSFPSVLGVNAARIELAVDHYLERFREVGWREHTVYPGIPELIALLAARGDRIAVVTSKIEEHARRIVDNLPFGHRFDAVYGPGHGEDINGKADLVARALGDLGGDVADTSMVGDRCFDIEGARTNGVRSIGVLWGFGTVEELLGAGADHVVANVAALEACLARQ